MHLDAHDMHDQVMEWLSSPYDIAERSLAKTNMASLGMRRAIMLTCSSTFLDCTDTGHICTPARVEGSQGPNFPDAACANAIDDDENTAWAVNPADIKDEGGAGSSISVTLAKVATVTALRYKQVCIHV